MIIKAWRIFVVLTTLVPLTVEAGKISVPLGFRAISAQCGVPAQILLATSMTETETRMHDGTSGVWPYSINHRGHSYHYPTRKAMYHAVSKLIANGNRTIDIGLMQVNWRWHSHRVNNNLWRLTDPVENVKVACEILNEGFASRGNWLEAAGYYHAPNNQANAAQYMQRFQKKLARIHP